MDDRSRARPRGGAGDRPRNRPRPGGDDGFRGGPRPGLDDRSRPASRPGPGDRRRATPDAGRAGGSGPGPGDRGRPPWAGGPPPWQRPGGQPAGQGAGRGRPGPERGRPERGRPERGRPELGGRPGHGRAPFPEFIPPRPIAPLGDDDELVAGRRPVEEAFAAQRETHRLLVVPQRRQALERLVLHATTLRIPIVEVEGGSLTALAGFDGHQGIALVVGRRHFASLDDVLARAIERSEPAFVLVLDSLEDPQNLGTLLRSAEGAGVHGVVFPTARQAPLSPAAVKASAGATEHLLLTPVDDLPGALADLHTRGIRVVGSESDAPLTAREADLRGPIALVIGSEGQGLSPAVRRRCDLFVRIPMRGSIGSLNAAVAGSILLFEVVAQREGSPAPAAE
jgi:23S rRNA (guanosine2251-2'-O)-methyltransferase